MADVFISYSRKDTAFVRRLHDALASRGRDSWVDWEDIPLTADWWKEVQAGIEAADAFVFIISPDSIRSEICRKEIDHAIANNKRLVPLLYRPTDEEANRGVMHPAIGTHNWIFFRDTDDFDKAFTSLLTALETDLRHVRQHTRLLLRAREWENGGQNISLLLRGDDLKTAENWLAEGVAKKPPPTALHAEYITASREGAVRRQRALLAGVTVALVVASGLAILSLLLFGEADRQRGIAIEAQGVAQVEAERAQTQAAIAAENAITATYAQGEAERQADIAQTQAARATIAQGREAIQADRAQTQAAIAAENAATATYAQGEAERQAGIAQTQAAIAQENAATAAFALGEAEIQRNAAQAQATNVANERNRAQSIALAGQAQLELENSQPERGVLIALHALQSYPYTWQAERALGAAVRTEFPYQEVFAGDAFTSVDWSPDGTRLVTASSDGEVRIIDPANGEVLEILSGHTSGVSRALWSPDGRHILSASRDDTARIWDATSGQLLFILRGHNADVFSIGWSPDGTRVATASEDQTARIWDATTGELIATLTGHSGSVNSVDWSPDGLKIVTASVDMTAKIWDASSGSELLTLAGHTAGVNRALWSPTGFRILTISNDATAKIWEAANGTDRHTLVGHVRDIERGLWSPNGTRIVTVSRDDSARVWNASTGTLQLVLYGHTSDLSAVDWSPDGTRLVTGSRDRTVRVWNAASGAELLAFTGHQAEVYSVAWSPDGTRIASASADRSTRIRDIWKDTQALIDFAQNCCVTRLLTDEESSQFGIPRAASAPPPADIESCPGALPSQLYPGVRGQVSSDDRRALNVRIMPNLGGQQVGQISPNKTFWVVEGPVCADSIAWFRVIYGINAASGWVAEGADGAYFVRPRP